MFCRYCGKENRQGAKFCSGCGKRIGVSDRAEPARVNNDFARQSGNALREQAQPGKPIRLVLVLLLVLALLVGGAVVGIRLLRGKSADSESGFLEGAASAAEENGSEDKSAPEAVQPNEQEAATQAPTPASTPEEQNVRSASTEPFTSAYADQHGYYGNSFENISQGGMSVSCEGWIYYTDANHDNSVWKMRKDGSEKTKVLDVPAWHMSIYNGWLYYREHSQRGYLCRYHLEDGTLETLVNRKVYEPKLVGRYIYYGDESDKSYDLYRIDIDGNNETKLTDGTVLYCCVTEQRIYYLDTRMDRKGYSVDLDGKDKQLWYAGRVGTIDYVDGLIYYTDADEGGLYTLNPEDNSVKKISNLTMWSINIYDGWVYYADGKNGGALTRTRLSEPENKETLTQDSSELINVSGGWIYYHRNGEDYDKEYYCIPIEGGDSKPL